MFDVAAALGAVLIGGLVALGLSGIVSMQAFFYFRAFPSDYTRVRATVGAIWILDLMHSALICAGSWQYLIGNWGNSNVLSQKIPTAISLTILITAVVTFIVHCFFTHRVLVLSRSNWWIAGPMFLLALARLVSAMTTTSLMIQLASWEAFLARFRWIFTFGLAVSALLDVLIALTLCFFLGTSRTGFESMDYIIDTIMLYTINNGSLTCVFAVTSLICWIAMPQNLIFLGFHFAISKLYANSFMATVNTRDTLRGHSHGSSDRDHPLPVIFPSLVSANRFRVDNENGLETQGTKLQITVEKTVMHDGDIDIDEDIRRATQGTAPSASSPARDNK